MEKRQLGLLIGVCALILIPIWLVLNGRDTDPLPLTAPAMTVTPERTPVAEPLASAPAAEAEEEETTAFGPVDIVTSGVRVFPEFDPEISDYAIRCGAGANDLTFTVTAGAEQTITMNGRAAMSGQATAVRAFEDDLVEISISDGGTAKVHYYRCLPAAVPDYQVDRPGTPTPGYYAVGFGLCVPECEGAQKYVALLDNHGVPIWYKQTHLPPLDVGAFDDGSIYWSYNDSIFEVHNLDGSLIRSVNANGYPIDAHELLRLANGNWLAMIYAPRPGVDMTSLGLGDDETAIDGLLQELTPEGEVVWEWRALDHIDVDDTFPPRDVFDLIHLNSAEELPDGDILLSARNANVFRIDRPSGQIVWKLGGTTTDDSLTFVDDPLGGPIAQHDARILADGTFSLLDNRSGTTDEGARLVVYDIDEEARTATLVREHTRDDLAASPFAGSARIADDGSVVIDWGGTLQPRMEELDANGNRLLSITELDQVWYRVVKFPTSTWDIDELRSNAGGSAENDAPRRPLFASTAPSEVTVSWSAPAVGSPIERYTVTATPGDLTCTTTTTSCVIGDLEPGEYVFVVAATNRWGVGAPTAGITVTIDDDGALTIEPTPTPTPTPTETPEPPPTVNAGGATATATPTATTVPVPTDGPTPTPTPAPPRATDVPAAVPTEVPPQATDVPTAVPTDVPPQATDVPTAAPTDVPVQPTVVPTAVPTVVPLAIPTDVPRL